MQIIIKIILNICKYIYNKNKQIIITTTTCKINIKYNNVAKYFKNICEPNMMKLYCSKSNSQECVVTW